MADNLQPECYKRHAEIEGHISEGKFWRGVIITAILSGIGILIAQYNMNIDNSNKMIMLTSKLSTIAESNIKRLDRIEDMMYCFKGDKQGLQGIQGVQSIKGEYNK